MQLGRGYMRITGIRNVIITAVIDYGLITILVAPIPCIDYSLIFRLQSLQSEFSDVHQDKENYIRVWIPVQYSSFSSLELLLMNMKLATD